MKLSISLSTILAILPALALAASPLDSRNINGDIYFPRHHARHFGRQRQGAFGSGNRGGQGQGQESTTASESASASASASGKKKSKSSTSVAAADSTSVAATSSAAKKNKAASTTAAAAAAASTTSKSGKNKNGGGRNGGQSSTDAAAAASSTDTATDTASSTDTATETASGTSSAAAATSSDASVAAANDNNPDTSLTLLSELVATGLELNGQETPTAGQVASLTSKNNFINFCAGKTITNGQQLVDGSCDPIPMGDIVPKANMPTCKFKNPVNFSTIKANQAFTIEMVLNNLQAGTFTNAQKTYYMAPQQLNGQKILIGHTHVVIQPMGDDFASGEILDPANFTFFKGINTGQDGNGVVTADVADGVPPGNYRLASINTDANHAPAVAAVAQHGSFDDMIYFTAK